MDELVRELKDITSKKEDNDEYLSMNLRYVSIKIEHKNFHPINFHPISGYVGKKMLFVDGGNSILFESAAFCIGFIRVGGILYSEGKRITRKSEEFYVSVKESDGKYSVKTYPETSFSDMTFNPDDESLRNGMERCDMSRIISLIRRFAEIDHAFRNSADADYLLLDGTLEARYPSEDKYLERLFTTGKACALSKTCSLTTKNGISITRLLHDSSEDINSAWYYNPIVINDNPKHHAEIYFVRLHERSGYVFRFEIQDRFRGDVHEMFSALVHDSKDPIFLGYPYGLIDVDQYVRISEEESELLRTKISVKFGKGWNDFSKSLNSMNAHSVLDKIRF